MNMVASINNPDFFDLLIQVKVPLYKAGLVEEVFLRIGATEYGRRSLIQILATGVVYPSEFNILLEEAPGLFTPPAGTVRRVIRLLYQAKKPMRSTTLLGYMDFKNIRPPKCS